MPLSERTILITGGAGYVGSHCARWVRESGCFPVVYDNLSTGHRDFVRWGPLVEGDIMDRRKLRSAFEHYRPSAVMHFAALALVGESVRHPYEYWRTNTEGTLNLLRVMNEVDVKQLVFSSTCAVYGSPKEVPIVEGTLKDPVNPYGASKLAAERIMDDFSIAYGIKTVQLRYFNACGAASDAALGEDRANETHLIPLVLDAASGRRAAISVFGHDYPTPDGTAVRDYVHVKDLSNAHVAALNYLAEGGSTIALNLGTGRGHSVSEVIAAAEEITGLKIKKVIVARREGDPPNLVANPRKAREVLRWEARCSDLPTIVEDAWRWHRERFSV